VAVGRHQKREQAEVSSSRVIEKKWVGLTGKEFIEVELGHGFSTFCHAWHGSGREGGTKSNPYTAFPDAYPWNSRQNTNAGSLPTLS
jgi:hypothetical protein